jgi:23S rRNA (cytidine1920-2'-O)/16S rRNA (cytidine1409-2'-O)-methyltransferase
MAKRRLDTLLAERGLLPSRARAAASVMAGKVTVGADGRRATKPGELVDELVALHVEAPPPYVSRGGIKLANALDAAGLVVAGRRALDVGSSTGGFSDCLLQRGVVALVALDVGYGLLDLKVRDDPRVVVLERVNARALRPEQLPFGPEVIVVDVSFISLTRVLGAVLACAAPGFDALAMVKPQFEVGRGRVGKGGVVRDPGARADAVRGVARHAEGLGHAVLEVLPSGLPGPKGNVETFLWIAERGRPGALDPAALERAVGEVA